MRLAFVAALLVAGGAQARELPPLEHSRCHAIAVNRGLAPEPNDEYGRAVVRIGREILERDWNGRLENRETTSDAEAEARLQLERELYRAGECEALIGVAAR